MFDTAHGEDRRGVAGAPDGDPPLVAIAVGMSAGGVSALRTFLKSLPAEVKVPVVIAQHVGGASLLPELVRWWTTSEARFARHGEMLQNGHIYVCPPQHHISINPDATVGVLARDRLRSVRPSIDWLFESAAGSFGDRAIAIVLSGANTDGARGARAVRRAGGHVLVQDPATAAYADMPQAALREPGEIGLHPMQLGHAVVRALASIHDAYPHGYTEPFLA